MTDFIQNIVNQAFEVANNAQLLDEVEFFEEKVFDINQDEVIRTSYDPKERKDEDDYEPATGNALDELNRLVQRRESTTGEPVYRRMDKVSLIKVKASVDSINADYPRTPSGRGPDIKEMVRLSVTKKSLNNYNEELAIKIQNGIARFRSNEYEVDSISEDSADGIISVNLSRNL